MTCQLILIINNSLVIIVSTVTANIQEIICLINPPTLFKRCGIGRYAKLLQPLTFNKKSPTVQEGDYGATGSMGFAFRR